jgi:hypothetical protein
VIYCVLKTTLEGNNCKYANKHAYLDLLLIVPPGFVLVSALLIHFILQTIEQTNAFLYVLAYLHIKKLEHVNIRAQTIQSMALMLYT